MRGRVSTGEQGVSGGDRSPYLIAAAHELKSPLALIRQLALDIADPDCSDSARVTLAERISLTAERALRLTSDLTRSVRLDDSLFALEPINPLELLDDVAREITPLYAARQRQIEVKPHAWPLLIVANRDLLRRVMLSFCDNALHYSHAERPVQLVATASPARSSIRLAVRDYGPAVPTQLWQELATRLGRRAQPLPSRPLGSGLGIQIAEQFASAMDARVGAIRHSDGATFYIDLNASTQMSLL